MRRASISCRETPWQQLSLSSPPVGCAGSILAPACSSEGERSDGGHDEPPHVSGLFVGTEGVEALADKEGVGDRGKHRDHPVADGRGNVDARRRGHDERAYCDEGVSEVLEDGTELFVLLETPRLGPHLRHERE